jgi:hypothetical protein
MWPFSCTHPARNLVVEKTHTAKPTDDPDILRLTYHLKCVGCGAPVDISHAHLTVPFKEWLNRPLTPEQEAIYQEVFNNKGA